MIVGVLYSLQKMIIVTKKLRMCVFEDCLIYLQAAAVVLFLIQGTL